MLKRVAAIYDIHGNLPALDAVLADVRHAGVDHLVVGGDVVPGPMPRETLARLRAFDIPATFIRGNGDRMVMEAMRGIAPSALPTQVQEVIAWVAEQLDDEDEAAFAAWPGTARIEIAGLGPVLFCHATPRNDVEIFTRTTAEERVLPALSGVDAALVICGHTHMQFDRAIGGVRVVNAGSAGLPFGGTGAFWVLLGPGVQLRRTEYDLEAAAARVRASGYPRADEFAAQDLLRPKSEDEWLETFRRVEL